MRGVKRIKRKAHALRREVDRRRLKLNAPGQTAIRSALHSRARKQEEARGGAAEKKEEGRRNSKAERRGEETSERMLNCARCRTVLSEKSSSTTTSRRGGQQPATTESCFFLSTIPELDGEGKGPAEGEGRRAPRSRRSPTGRGGGESSVPSSPPRCFLATGAPGPKQFHGPTGHPEGDLTCTGPQPPSSASSRKAPRRKGSLRPPRAPETGQSS